MMANRVVALLSTMLNYAMDKGVYPEGPNPCKRVKRYAERSKERFLLNDELGRLGERMQEAQTTLKALQTERELAERIERGIKQLRKNAPADKKQKLA